MKKILSIKGISPAFIGDTLRQKIYLEGLIYNGLTYRELHKGYNNAARGLM